MIYARQITQKFCCYTGQLRSGSCSYIKKDRQLKMHEKFKEFKFSTTVKRRGRLLGILNQNIAFILGELYGFSAFFSISRLSLYGTEFF